MGTCIAIGQQIMRITEVHIMPHCMENRFPTIMQIESILIGMGMIARTERTGTKTQADILFFKSLKLLLAIISPQSLKPYSFRPHPPEVHNWPALLGGCETVETGFKLGIIPVVDSRIPGCIRVTGSTGQEIGKSAPDA